ncbi:tumor necrosis factor a (TNF superfamily, member 2) isoform X2 [Girardinichthys multiradiatus]|uniref:tumor necrosis factor a (TNF superfamily, member 2) isoform X2 n=1 Tax=Girardinichthys multiradiatus TaxID=208333 RepID=UPI001FADFB6C|nr:tumor necrosis factor a (TNF superfamily, member 2) isoform X2 [Girardinichthys multiradiatus]
MMESGQLSGKVTPRSNDEVQAFLAIIGDCNIQRQLDGATRNEKSEGLDEDSFDLHHALRQITNRRAAIHLEGEYDPTIRTSVKWMSQVDQSHSQGGLELKDNEILIPQNGLYFVYSQVSFRVSCSSRDADDITSMVHLSHTVKRWSSSFGSKGEQSYQTILHSVRTACQITASADPDSVGSWFSAVYMGAVFNLRRGDRLKTVMEEKMLENLEDESGKTFFGVFAL